MKPYPLKFKPEMKERVWGGRALEQFGFVLPEGHIGEAWTIGDHQNGTTTIINGELAGMGLDQIREQHGEAFFGSKGYTGNNSRFPLLIKLLDCQDDLSVQVHPNDHYDRLPAGELGKTEMWYIMDAKPDAKIIYGLRDGIGRQELSAAIDSGKIMDKLQEVSVQAGDSFYIPAGTVHALCSGVLVAEIQQNSDTTYRLYDYNRPGLDGKPRDLHVEDSLNVIAYEGAGASRMNTNDAKANEWLELAHSPYFVTEKGVVQDLWNLETSPETFTILVVCDGQGTLKWSDGELALTPGDCCLLPAVLGEYSLTGQLTVLRSYLP
ncbi:MAG: class I mannose-6-phosphate isomerase [Gorillibacterium sp.]|nr:class I mannose-6-phosphate isomerase [Gorillibacterium sp.]